MKLKRRGLFARISATVVALLMVLFSTISVAYGLGDNDGVDETPVVATEPAESTEEPTQEAEEQSSEVIEPEKAEVVEEALPAAEAPDATEEAVSDDDATETSDDSDAAADKAAADEKVEQAAKVDDKAEAKEAAVGKTTKKEEPKKTSAPEPKASPSPSSSLSISLKDLEVTCVDGGSSITVANEGPGNISLIAGWFNSQGEEISLVGRGINLAPGENENVDTTSVPKGTEVAYAFTVYRYLEDDIEALGGNGTVLCGSAGEPSPEPTEEPEPRPVDVGRDSKTGLVTATNPEGNPSVVVVVRDNNDKELERVSLKPGETGTVGTDRCEEVSIGIIVGDADEQFWGEFPAEDCTPVPSPSPTPTETVKPSPTPTPEPTAPEPTPSATPTPTPTPTQEPTRPVTPKPSPTTEPTATPSERPTAEPTSDKDGGSKDGDKDKGKKGTKPKLPKSGVSDDDPIVAIVGATVLAAAVSAGGLVAWRRRAS